MEQGEKVKKAVALRYDQTKENAPRVVAAGKGYQAERIVQLARDSKLPVHKDPTLVDMLSYLDLGSEIPEELYQMVAEVLAFVYTLDKKARKQGGGKV